MKNAMVVVLVAGIAMPAVVAADVIRLKNGRTLEVEGWRDAGDSIEFAAGGGIVRISKSEVDKVDGTPRRGDLKMYSSGVSSSAANTLERSEAVNRMKDLLGQGEGLFGQATLSAAEKAGVFRRLTEKWREFEVPDALRDAHDRGRTALQSAADAFGSDAIDPDTRARIEKARQDIQALSEEVKKLGGAS